jgi:hypothetical protein
VKVYRGGEAEDTTKTAVAQPVELRGVKGSVHEKALKRDAKSHSPGWFSIQRLGIDKVSVLYRIDQPIQRRAP